VPGAAELRNWFGSFPSFHDANVASLDIRADGHGATGHLKLKAFRMTDKVDSEGFFVLEKHCLVTLEFGEIVAVNLNEFMQGAIIFSLDIRKAGDEFEVEIESSYGFQGSLRTRKISIEFEAAAAR
jgi:hypothetical protein